jgi:hypothetical protein
MPVKIVEGGSGNGTRVQEPLQQGAVQWISNPLHAHKCLILNLRLGVCVRTVPDRGRDGEVWACQSADLGGDRIPGQTLQQAAPCTTWQPSGD